MKHKTAELTGPLLRRAVAMALGYRLTRESGLLPLGHPDRADPEGSEWAVWFDDGPPRSLTTYGWCPDEKWEHGGPLVDRLRDMERDRFTGVAIVSMEHQARADGCQLSYAAAPTVLVATCRCVVAGVFGEEVELP